MGRVPPPPVRYRLASGIAGASLRTETLQHAFVNLVAVDEHGLTGIDALDAPNDFGCPRLLDFGVRDGLGSHVGVR